MFCPLTFKPGNPIYLLKTLAFNKDIQSFDFEIQQKNSQIIILHKNCIGHLLPLSIVDTMY